MFNSPYLLFSEPHIVIPEDYGNEESPILGLSQTEFHIVIPEEYREQQLTSLNQSPKLILLGELLQEAALVTEQQIRVALEEQKGGSDLRIGEILALHGWIIPDTADFFAQKWHHLLKNPFSYPIGYYFQQASLLDEQQIERILREQKQMGLRFGEVAILDGFIQEKTLAFFLKYLRPTLNSNCTDKSNTLFFQEKGKKETEDSKVINPEDIPWID